jgi:hypothetical protein
MGDLADFLDNPANRVGGIGGALGQLAHFVGHHGKPRPISPARAASMAALRASRLV